MASDDKTEVFMQLIQDSGLYLGAECRTEVSSDWDDLILDYENGSFFAVDDFSFGMNIDDKDPTADTTNAGGGRGVGAAGVNLAAGPQVKFGKWKSGTAEDVKKMVPFPVRMDEFSITRRYDRASPVLFEKCVTSDSFKSASLVKRKVVGGDMLQTFLRLDFKDVLITHIDWSDGETIKETVKFVFRAITVQYKTQKPDGKLNAAGSVEWRYDAGLRRPVGGR